MAQVLSPLSLGELLDRTFQLYRRHFLIFIGIITLPHVFLLPLQLASVWQRSTRRFDMVDVAFAMVIAGGGIFVLAIAQAATVVAVSRLYLGQSASIVDSYSRVSGHVVRLCLLILSVGILTGLGFLLLIIPGILLTLRWSVAVPAMVLEDTRIGEAMTRSAELTSGDWIRIFGIYFIYFVVAILFETLWQVPMFFVAFSSGRTLADPPFWTQIVIVLGGFVSQCLVGPLLTIALSLVYYDERVRKEAFDLEHMLTQLDGAPPSDALPA
jgi:hypothetical protein